MKPLALALALASLPVLAEDAPRPSGSGMDQVGEALFRKVDPSVVTIYHETAQGSGYIVSADGLIVTNGHVVMDSTDDEDPKAIAKRITVVLANEHKYTAKVLGHCLDPDVALVKIEADEPLVPVELGDSDAVKPGQRCFALGTPQGLKRTLTSGIISNVERTDLGTFTVVLQTDAAINHGNSGGPLFNEQGQVLGTNTYGYDGTNNLGFTVPVNVVKVLKDDYLRCGRFLRSDVPTVTMQEVTPDLAKSLGAEKGVLVDFVVPGSPAEKAGLRSGDVITGMNGEDVAAQTRAELLKFNWRLVTLPVGSTVQLRVQNPLEKGAEARVVSFVLREDDPAPSLGLQRGEIPQSLFDELGLGVQRIVDASRLAYNLPWDPGVMISDVQPNTPAHKAGLGRGDVLKEVAGKPVTSPETFRSALLEALRGRPKAVPVVVRRQKSLIRTALAPYYTLAGKRVALLVPAKNAEWSDLLGLALTVSGADLTVTSSAGSLKAEGLDGLVLAGGEGSAAFQDDADLASLVRELVKGGKALAAVGPGTLALVKAEPSLLEKKITTSEDQAQAASALKARNTGKAVETDGRVVTCTGLDKSTVKAFIKAMKGVLSSPE